MKQLMILSGLLLGLTVVTANGLAGPCFLSNQKETKLGANKGIAGMCSNNGASVTCVISDDQILTCTGPGGGYSGDDLDSLIFSACNCYNDRDPDGYRLKTN